MSLQEPGDHRWVRVRVLGPQDAESCYRVEVEMDDGRWFQHKMKLGDDEERGLVAIAPGDTQAYGERLYQLLFSHAAKSNGPNLDQALQNAWGRAAESRSRQLRIQLWISEECSELHRFRWERLFMPLDNQSRALANFSQTPFSRFTRLPLRDPQPGTGDRPLRVLMAVSNPSNLADLPGELAEVEVEKEIENFFNAVEGFPEVWVTFAPGRTGIKKKSLLAKLTPPRFRILKKDDKEESTTIKLIQRELADHHVLHFVGHGVFDKGKKLILPGGDASTKDAGADKDAGTNQRELNKKATWLVLEKEDGTVDTVEDAGIVHNLIQRGENNLPRLIFLCSCDTSRYDERNPRAFNSLAPRLVEAGFPAVVAMQDKVPVDVAGELTRNFYGNLLEEGVIDSALNRSRWFLYDQKKLLDNWTIPVLFMRTPRGQLFTADPRRVALRAISESAQFAPSWNYSYLPLEAVVLVGDQIKLNWEKTVMLARARVDLRHHLEKLLDGTDTPSPLIIALTGERGTARSTTAKALVRETAALSLAPLAEPAEKDHEQIYIDLDALRRTRGKVHSLVSKRIEQAQQSANERLKFRIIFHNGDNLTEAARKALLKEINACATEFPDSQFLMRRMTLPVYVSLDVLVAPSGRVPSYQSLLAQSLKEFWPEPLTEEKMNQLLKDFRFRIVLDNGDDLSENQRGQLLEQLRKLTQDHPQHQYVIVMGRGMWRVEQDKSSSPKVAITHLLDVQPISRQRIEKFLDTCVEDDRKAETARQRAMAGMEYEQHLASDGSASSDDSGEPSVAIETISFKSPLQELRPQLEKTQLFDLAAMPWMLVQMVKQAQTGDLPQSRIGVLRGLIEEKIGFIMRWRGQQARALDTLYDLAYQLQRQNVPSLPIKDALNVIARVRENREYALEEMLDSLVEQDILARAGNDSVRFLYPQYQAYCCAQYLCRQNDPRAWEEITAGLGRITHLRRWNDTLTLLSGLIDDPNVLLETLAYATSLKDGEQVYLAARCLLEARQSGNLAGNLAATPSGQANAAANGVPSGSYVESLVLDALVWRSDTANEARALQRLRAVEALGRQSNPEVVQFLARIAMSKTRMNSLGKKDFEYGGIRQAAGRALRRLLSGKNEEEKQRFAGALLLADPYLEKLIKMWIREDLESLIKQMGQDLSEKKQNGEARDENELETAQALAGMAAFALGDLNREEACASLIEAFKSGKTASVVHWAITDALTVVEPDYVIRKAIRPMLDGGTLASSTKENSERREQLIYLIGQLRVLEKQSLVFINSVLQEQGVPAEQKGRAMLAIGFLHPADWAMWKDIFEQVALGKFAAISAEADEKTDNALYLRTKALQALAEIGDLQTLSRLREGRQRSLTEIGKDSQQWPAKLEQVFYNVSEEIVWRNNG